MLSAERKGAPAAFGGVGPLAGKTRLIAHAGALNTEEACRYARRAFALGYDMAAAIALGADGSIGSTFNFMAGHFRKIFDLAKAGQAAEARRPFLPLGAQSKQAVRAAIGEKLENG